MKTCVKCGEVKPVTEFYKDASKRDGLSSYCKPCRIASSDEWCRKNRDRVRFIKTKWRLMNPDKVKAANDRYCATNPDKRMESIVKWNDANPEKVRANSRIQCHTRRARIKGAEGRLSPGLAKRLFDIQRGKCACGCKQPLGDDYHLDHIMPLALGGTNTDDNIQLLLAKCNKQKRAKHPIDFMQQRGFLL